jgi:molybdopterin molybdotransferase
VENLSFEEARDTILRRVSPIGIVQERLLDCLHRVAAEDVAAPLNLPSFENSAMDGFAVPFAEGDKPTAFSIVGFVPAGETSPIHVDPGTAIRIMTGAPVPQGCDTVIPFEDVDEFDSTIRLKPGADILPGRHIRRAGEDVKQGNTVLTSGTVIGVAEICMLASLGRTSLRVYRKPQVAILATGDELVAPGEPLTPGKVFDCNSQALAAAVIEAGAAPVILGIARDDRESLKAKLAEGLNADVLLTVAGVSVGDRDLVRPILEELGVKQEFWKVKIKPGKAFAFGLKEGKPVFSLPGNPVSALVVFEEFLRPALLRMMGHRRVLKRPLTAVLQQEIGKKKGRVFFSRLRLEHADGILQAWSAGKQDTGSLSTMLNADALAVFPEDGTQFSVGDQVLIHALSNRFDMMEPFEEGIFPEVPSAYPSALSR